MLEGNSAARVSICFTTGNTPAQETRPRKVSTEQNWHRRVEPKPQVDRTPCSATNLQRNIQEKKHQFGGTSFGPIKQSKQAQRATHVRQRNIHRGKERRQKERKWSGSSEVPFCASEPKAQTAKGVFSSAHTSSQNQQDRTQFRQQANNNTDTCVNEKNPEREDSRNKPDQ